MKRSLSILVLMLAVVSSSFAFEEPVVKEKRKKKEKTEKKAEKKSEKKKFEKSCGIAGKH